MSKERLYIIGALAALALILGSIFLTSGNDIVIEDGANVNSIEVQDSVVQDTSEAVLDTIR